VFTKPGSVHRAAVKDVRNVRTMKRIGMITVLAVLLISAVGMTTVMAEGPAKTALSCVPFTVEPAIGDKFQITGILTYGTSSTPVPGQLITVYTLADEKKWMDEKWTEAGSVDTGENGQYTVTTSQPNAGNYSYRAVFEGDKSFKKVTSPTISVTVKPVAGDYIYTPIYGFTLQNEGWFLAKIACYYSTDSGVTWHESGHTDNIIKDWGFGAGYLDELGVPVGAMVRIHVIVVGGKDRTGSEVFQYAPEIHLRGYYIISGTTGNPKLEYIRLT
jgi:hypothetical protein